MARISPTTYFHTLRYLRFGQLVDRVKRNVYQPRADLSPPPAIRSPLRHWRAPAKKAPSLVGPNRFRFLNEEHEIATPADWNSPTCAKLWLYNLHYFDDLNAAAASERTNWHRSLMVRWVRENPPGAGNGWEPHPLSLRIVNWIKWALAGNDLPRTALESLAVQTRFLAERLEFHLLGNHLFANAKALVFAGMFFEGIEADRWVNKGISVARRELKEQVLADGGHCELSPMYHGIVLEDLLDLINLIERCSIRSPALGFHTDVPQESHHQKRDTRYAVALVKASRQMIAWLRTLCHPDGQIALFNDAAFGIAPHPTELFAYAERLETRGGEGLALTQSSPGTNGVDTYSLGRVRVTHLRASGYIRVENGPMTAILDVASIQPAYQPGHSHADTLSFEMSLSNHRVIVDSGTSIYQEGAARRRQRSTGAHNTVVIDGKDSSEVWGSFRMARRARVLNLEIQEGPEGGVVVRCAHDGYRRLPGKPVHRREWHFREHSLEVRDRIEGRQTEAVGRFHFHPDVRVTLDRQGSAGTIESMHREKFRWRVVEGLGKVGDSEYHPEFGTAHPNQCIELQLVSNVAHVVFEWQ